jgi:small conductance mechanosensitive channel
MTKSDEFVEMLHSFFTVQAVPMLTNVVLALLVFFIGKKVAKVLNGIVKKLLKKANVDDVLIDFLGGIVYGILLLVVVIASLEQLGVDTTSLVALVGAAGLAIGFALKDSLSNFASGVMLIIFRPFKTGDFIDAGGVAGTVENITIFNTIIRTGDNKEIIVPNSSVYGGTITNYSAKPTRRVDMVFGIGYGDDLKQAKELLIKLLAEDDRVLDEPKAGVAVAELGDNSVNFNVRPWVKSADYWGLRNDMLERVKLEFDAAGISIPYPQMDVHVHKAASSEEK